MEIFDSEPDEREPYVCFQLAAFKRVLYRIAADDHLERLVAREPNVFNGRVTAQPGGPSSLGLKRVAVHVLHSVLFFLFIFQGCVNLVNSMTRTSSSGQRIKNQPSVKLSKKTKTKNTQITE